LNAGQRPPLLSSPANIAASRIIQARVETAASTVGRLGDPGDRDALHDFRVALRRLRSALRAYRPWLGRAASRNVRSRLRDLGKTTNLGRDSEVQAAWVTSNVCNLPEPARRGAEQLVERLHKHRALHVRQLQSEFDHIEDKILKRLNFHDRSGPGFTVAYRALLAAHVADVAASLAAVTNADQVEEAHEARIAAKRLRYLVEPLVEELCGAPALLDKVESLQTLLGDLHDSHVLDETLADADTSRRIPRPALAALVAENAKRRAVVFATLEKCALGPAPPPFLEQIRRLAEPA
jgi:CHAD domain-containing protein